MPKPPIPPPYCPIMFRYISTLNDFEIPTYVIQVLILFLITLSQNHLGNRILFTNSPRSIKQQRRNITVNLIYIYRHFLLTNPRHPLPARAICAIQTGRNGAPGSEDLSAEVPCCAVLDVSWEIIDCEHG
jgi:hypothetical protein